MLKYIMKRLLLLIPILFGVTFIIFAVMEFTPGDPAIRILGSDAEQAAVEQLRHQLGLDKPFLLRFFNYVGNVIFKFDFGNSWRTNQPVFRDLLPRIPTTIRLAIFGVTFATLFGIPLGVFSAVKQNSFGDNIARVLATVFVSMPSFWFAMLLILLFALKLSWLPAVDDQTWKSYVMPVMALALPAGCRIMRMTRSTMLESIREDYVRTAKAKGVPNRHVIYRHALQNALLPVINEVGATFKSQLGGSVVIESVFALPGLGSLTVLSIKSKDTPSLLACVTLIALLGALIMLAVDIIYAYIDPRIKAKYAKV